MITDKSFTKVWIDSIKMQNDKAKINPPLLEKMTYALSNDDDDIFAKIQNGILDLSHFKETMTAFEESRQDRHLYGRN